MNVATQRQSRLFDQNDRKREGPRPMHISLRAGEKIFINGAVVRVDRKVTFELLNDATFLMENHVLQVEDTTTPLRQLYFAVQAILMDPQNADASRRLFETIAGELKKSLRSAALCEGVEEAVHQVAAGRPFHALKTLRSLFSEEAAILGAPEAERPKPVRTVASDASPFERNRPSEATSKVKPDDPAGESGFGLPTDREMRPLR